MAEKMSVWQALCFRTLPRFYPKSTGLTPSRIAGDCLAPFLLPGDLVVVDTSLDARSGELVLVNMRYRRQLGSAGCVTVGGGVMYRYEHAIKQLLVVDDVAHLTCASGSVRADGHEILGPVVSTSRRGWRRAPLSDMDFSSNIPARTAQAS